MSGLHGQTHTDVIVEKLENGLTVYLNPDPTVKEIFGAVVVNAGSKNDPHDATGMAHYLEHLLFKGTQEMGTWNYDAEKIHLDSITSLYHQLGKVKHQGERKKILLEINRQAVKASKYGLPNDFDTLLKSIGSTKVNAFTSPDMTFYYNAFPPNQIRKWLDIYAHRFSQPVLRSFQSELEVVYEEKNRALEGYEFMLNEEFMKGVFPNHPYGTQTTLGSAEHLKNPPLTRIYEYFNRYYVPNNMALVLVGDLNPDEIKPMIQETFGKLEANRQYLPEMNRTIPENNSEKVEKVRMSPYKSLMVAFRTVPAEHPDRPALDILESMLSNSDKTGLLDQLVRNGKIKRAELRSIVFDDAGASALTIVPKSGIGAFRKANKNLDKILENVRNGDFSINLLETIKTRTYREFKLEMEEPESRAKLIGTAFQEGRDWDEVKAYPQKILAIRRGDIVHVAKKYFGENRFVLQSKRGIPKREKLTKPPHRPYRPDPSRHSSYSKTFAELPQSDKAPRFIDFEKDVTFLDLKNNNHLYVTNNPVNDIFSLRISYQYGEEGSRPMTLGAILLNHAGTRLQTASGLKEEFAKLGATCWVAPSRNYLHIDVKGIEKNLEETLKLLDQWIHFSELNEEAVQSLYNDIKNKREVEKRTPSVMGKAMRNYAMYGRGSGFLARIKVKTIKDLNPKGFEKALKKGTDFAADIHYVGNRSPEEFKKILLSGFTLSKSNKREPLRLPTYRKYDQNYIYFIHDKFVRQSQIYFYIKGKPFLKEDYSKYKVFNDYLGDGFSGLILQEIREYRSLAYSTWGKYHPPLKEGQYAYFNAYVGCQAEKTNQAVGAMMGLINNMPDKPERMPRIVSGLKQKSFSAYPHFRELSKVMVSLQSKDWEVDPDQMAYEEYENLSYEEIKTFYQEHLQGKPCVITIYGNRNKFDLEKLNKYGKVIELAPNDVIRY